ncbi:MAG: methylmalonyl Co-A mutase-associated GTPase MeaB [Candidatus Aminicenantes bacterium]
MEKILEGDPASIAKGISFVENSPNEAKAMMKALFPHTGNAKVIGITGAPGTGKSTLVDQMIDVLIERNNKIGIIAVDPSSPFTGGAILGDRIRMMRHSVHPEVFIRSMATRGHLGGLAKASGEALFILEAAGKNCLLLETVGVGQDEIEVVKLADVIILVLTPGSGDEIQIFKAGIMEIADIFVINKADSPDAEQTERQIMAMLELGKKGDTAPPVLKTVATEGRGITSLIQGIDDIISSRKEETHAERRKQRIAYLLKEILKERLLTEAMKRIRDVDFDEWVDNIYDHSSDPYTVAEGIIETLSKKV